MPSMSRLLWLLAVVPLLAACGDDGAVTAGDGSDGPDGAALAEEYLSVEVAEDGAPRPLVDGTQIVLRFDEDEVTAQLGCNILRGRYELDGDVLAVDGIGGTEMGCPAELHAQDEWFAGLLASGPTVVVDGDVLTLRSGGTVVRLVDRQVAEPDASLVGTTWEVDGFADGQAPDDAAMSSATDRPASVRFEEDGFVSGHDGCNGFGYSSSEGTAPEGLRYEVDGDRLRFTGAPVTELQACPDRTDVDRFWSALTGTATWSIDGDRLTLIGGDGRVVTLRATG